MGFVSVWEIETPPAQKPEAVPVANRDRYLMTMPWIRSRFNDDFSGKGYARYALADHDRFRQSV